MKRRTDILTHLLLLLLVLVACTADDAIKENLSHQDEYVTVRMHIPGMKAVATRAAEADNITSIVALVFRNDQLQSVTEYSNSALHPISPISGTITIDKPNNGDVIHFLANLPANYSEGVTYVDYLKGFLDQNKTQEDVLRNLSSRDYSKLSYWGMATRNENNAVMDVMLYRNKAMIEIKPGENCTFRQDELFIAGLDNPNNVGLLVPYKDGFNFDLDNNDYQTLPADPDPLDKTDELTNYGAGYDNAYYVFEHENPDDATGLYVICKIGDDYYKVALHDEKGQPYPIIRNHKYTILVNDLDAGCETYSEALSADPIKPTVIETKDVTLTLSPQISSLNYSSAQASVEAITVKVGGLQGVVEKLTFNAPGFIISSDYAESEGNGVYRIINSSLQDIDFTFTLDNPSAENAGSISVTGEGGNVNTINTASTTVTLTESSVPEGQTIIWQGAVVMHIPDDGAKNAAKITIPYSFFFDGSGNLQIPVGSKVVVESTGNGWMQAFRIKGEWVNIWDINSGTSELTLTQDVLNTIKEYHETAWGVDVAFVLQGGDGRVLNKVTLIPAKESIKANMTSGSTLYYDSDDVQNATIHVTIPAGVTSLNIEAADFSTVSVDGGYTVNGDAANGYSVSLAEDGEKQINFTFTLDKSKFNGQIENTSTVITFRDESGKVTEAPVTINLEKTPIISFSKTGTQTITLNGSPLSVEMDTYGKSLSEFGITVTPATGLNVTQDGNQLTLNNDGVYSTNEGVSGTQTFTFTPTAAGTYTITFSGSGTDVNMPEIDGRKIILTVNAAATGGDGNIVWQWTGDDVNVSGYNTSSSIIPSSDINEQFIVNNIFGIKVEPTAGANDPCVVVKVFNRYGTGKDLSSTAHNNSSKDRINVSGSEIYEFLITQELVDLLHEQEDANNKGKIGFWGNDLIITDIYIKQGTANQ